MPLRVRVSLLAILDAFWFVLAAVQLSRGHVLIGALYLACGVVLTLLARRASALRR